MRLWDWTREVIQDQTGGIEPIGVGLERNPGAVTELGAVNPPGVPLYLLRVGLRGGFGQARAGLPVYRRTNPSQHPILKEIYHCEVAGKNLEAANIFALRDKVQRQLETIAPARKLPLGYFRAPRFDYSLPVYEEGAKLVCPVLAGPKIKAENLAELREPVVRHLHTAGYLTPGEDPEVLVLRPSDLRLVPPAAVIRSLDDAGFWLPTVEGSSPEGPVIGLLSHPAELRPPTQRRRRGAGEDDSVPPSGPDVTALLRYIAVEMARRGEIVDPWALYACDLRPEIWARTEELTDPTGVALTAHMEGGERLEMHARHTAAGELVAALSDRGIAVFLAGDQDALARAVGRYLVAHGFLRHADDVRPEIVTEAPAEALDPDSIWTGAPSGFAVEPTPELSSQTTTNEDQEVTRT
jgi:hypothetical protein